MLLYPCIFSVLSCSSLYAFLVNKVSVTDKKKNDDRNRELMRQVKIQFISHLQKSPSHFSNMKSQIYFCTLYMNFRHSHIQATNKYHLRSVLKCEGSWISHG